MADQQELERLSKELDASLKRIDNIQKGKTTVTFARRLYRWTTSPALIGALVAGGLFTVAMQRLEEKREYEAKCGAWEEEKQRLLAENQRLRDVADVRAAYLRSSIEAELAGSSRGLADRVRRALALAESTAPPSQPPAPAEKAAAPEGGRRFMV